MGVRRISWTITRKKWTVSGPHGLNGHHVQSLVGLENKQEKEQKQQLPKEWARNVQAITMREDHVSSKNAEFTVSGHLGVDGPPALSPVDVELNIEVGELSDMLDMVAGDVVEVVG